MTGNALIVLLLLAALAMIILWLIKEARSNTRYTRNYLEALTGAIYQTGYDDQKNSKPKKIWSYEESAKIGSDQRKILDAMKVLYERGCQDALEGRPSITEEISRYRQKQIEILENILATIKSYRDGSNPAESEKNKEAAP
jgi:hypothetical protein